MVVGAGDDVGTVVVVGCKDKVGLADGETV